MENPVVNLFVNRLRNSNESLVNQSESLVTRNLLPLVLNTSLETPGLEMFRMDISFWSPFLGVFMK